MKKYIRILILLFVLLLVGCSNNNNDNEEKPEEDKKIEEQTTSYTYKFKDENGNILKEVSSETPLSSDMYDGTLPTKESSEKYDYVFDHWNEITISDTCFEYVAVFKENIKSYKITFLNEDGSVFYSNTYEYGDYPYCDETPTKKGNNECEYSFDDWTPSLKIVTGEMTYTASFETIDKTYKITFLNEDGSTLYTKNFKYGETPSCDETPTKKSTKEFEYTFDSWIPQLEKVTSEKTYTASFKSSDRYYTVTFKNENGNIIKSEKYKYGVLPTIDTPTKESDEYYNYEFKCWEPEIKNVDSNVIYVAKFKKLVTIIFVVDGNEYIQLCEVGTLPVYNGSLTKEKTNDYEYIFEGWDHEIEIVENPACYFALFREVEREYVIKLVNENNELIETKNYKYGEMPEFTIQEKEADEQYYYTGEIYPQLDLVDSDKTYTLKYNKYIRNYIVEYVSDTGSLLKCYYVNYGEDIPKYDGTPTKEGVDNKTYVFNSWDITEGKVTHNITITAKFDCFKNYNFIYGNNTTVVKTIKEDEDIMNNLLDNSLPLVTFRNGTTYTKAKVYNGWYDNGDYSFKENEYIVSFDTSFNDTNYTHDSDMTLQNFTKEHYVYSLCKVSIGGKLSEIKKLSEITCDCSIYVMFNPETYSITYVLNGGTGSESNPTTYPYMGTIEDCVYGTSISSPTKVGYTFNGWYFDENFTDKIELAKMSGYYINYERSNITLYAKFTANEYTITYDGAGGNDTYTYFNVYYHYNDSVEVRNHLVGDEFSVYEFVPSGNFKAWFFDKECTNRVIEDFTVYGDLHLYALFSDTNVFAYYVYNSTDYNNNSQTITVTGKGTKMYLQVSASFCTGNGSDESVRFRVTDNGKEIISQYISGSNKTASVKETILIEIGHTLHVEMTTSGGVYTGRTFSVTEVKNPDVSCVSDKTITKCLVPYDTAITNIPVYVKDGYTFDGWYYNDELFDFTKTYTLTSDITLVAKWKSL